MLHYEAIDPSTLDILNRLFRIPAFDGLRLVGGTALALQLGHRKSIDIDLFGSLDIDEMTLVKTLREFREVHTIQRTENIGIYSIEGVKVDIVNYPYPWLFPHMEEENLRLARREDIAAMKLSAVTGRGTKKDFIDIYYLLKDFSLKQLLKFYSAKYDDGSEFLVIKSLTYFEDAELDPDPVILHPVKWADIKKSITNQLKKYG